MYIIIRFMSMLAKLKIISRIWLITDILGIDVNLKPICVFLSNAHS